MDRHLERIADMAISLTPQDTLLASANEAAEEVDNGTPPDGAMSTGECIAVRHILEGATHRPEEEQVTRARFAAYAALDLL